MRVGHALSRKVVRTAWRVPVLSCTINGAITISWFAQAFHSRLTTTVVNVEFARLFHSTFLRHAIT